MAVVGVVVALASPLGAGGSPVAPSSCAEAQSSANVAIAVDFGTVPGSPGGVQRRCVPGVAGRDGISVLGAAGFTLRFNDAGLLCGIGPPSGAVYPASGCGERTSSGYRYWAYFTGTAGGWQYMSVGPGFRKASAGVTEGWHFVEGTGKPGDPPPNAPADPAATCVPAPSTTTTAAAPIVVPTVTAPRVVPTPLPAGDAVPGGAAPPAGGAQSAGGADPTSTAPTSSTTPGEPPAGAPGDATSGEVPAAARGTVPAEAGAADPGGSTDGTTGGDGVSELAAVPAAAGAEAGGAPWAVGGVAVVGVGLAAAAVVRMRRGADT
ncbi:MAG: hypothetical protein U0Q07_03715 [Acidimicrobiales bacterium]